MCVLGPKSEHMTVWCFSNGQEVEKGKSTQSFVAVTGCQAQMWGHVPHYFLPTHITHKARVDLLRETQYPTFPACGQLEKLEVARNSLQSLDIALWQSCLIGCKINHKVVNFGKWFLCQFSPKTWNFLHGAFLTPQKLEDEKVLTNLCMQRGEKRKKNVKRVFFTDKMGAKKIVLLNAMIFAFWTFVKNTLL